MNRLEQLRIDAGLSPEALAEKCDESSGMTIRRIEAGKKATPKTLASIAAALTSELKLDPPIRATELQHPAPVTEKAR